MLSPRRKRLSQVGYYNPADRQQQKELQRASDALRLRRADVLQADLRAENGFLSSLEIVDSSISFQEIFA